MKIVLISLVIVCLAACASTSNTATSSWNGGLPFATLLRGDQSGVTESGVHVARTADEWTALWREHSARVLPRPEPPAVDWTKDMVVLVTLGNRPSAGYALEIDKLAVDGEVLRIEAHETKPAPGLMVPMVVTSPYHLVTTARFGGLVKLELR